MTPYSCACCDERRFSHGGEKQWNDAARAFTSRLLYYPHADTKNSWFRLKNFKMFHRQGSSECGSRAGGWLNDLSCSFCAVAGRRNDFVPGSSCKPYSISSKNPLELLMCYMITSTACQSERWLWRLRGITCEAATQQLFCFSDFHFWLGVDRLKCLVFTVLSLQLVLALAISPLDAATG